MTASNVQRPVSRKIATGSFGSGAARLLFRRDAAKRSVLPRGEAKHAATKR